VGTSPAGRLIDNPIKGASMRERSPTQEEVRTQRQILQLILDAYPELFSEGDLEREMLAHPHGFGDRDAIARAVFGLVTVGLMHCCGPIIVPTRAALRLRDMERDEEA
jgi:hypothetical protein